MKETLAFLLEILDAVLFFAYRVGPPFIAVGTAFLAGRIAWSLIPVPAPVRAIERVMGEAKEERALPDVSLPPWLRALMPVSERTRANLRLLQALGRLQTLQEGDILVLRLAGMLVGLFFVLSGNPGVFLIGLALMALGYLSPDMWLAGQAGTARREILRELPDAAEDIAFLVSLGQPVDAALRRLAEGDTPLARLLRAGIVVAPPGVSTVDHLAEWVDGLGLPPLSQLFRRLQLVAHRGVGERTLLGDLAAAVAAQYEADLMARAQQLDHKLTPVMGTFFLLPYIALIILPFIPYALRVLSAAP